MLRMLDGVALIPEASGCSLGILDRGLLPDARVVAVTRSAYYYQLELVLQLHPSLNKKDLAMVAYGHTEA